MAHPKSTSIFIQNFPWVSLKGHSLTLADIVTALIHEPLGFWSQVSTASPLTAYPHPIPLGHSFGNVTITFTNSHKEHWFNVVTHNNHPLSQFFSVLGQTIICVPVCHHPVAPFVNVGVMFHQGVTPPPGVPYVLDHTSPSITKSCHHAVPLHTLIHAFTFFFFFFEAKE